MLGKSLATQGKRQQVSKHAHSQTSGRQQVVIAFLSLKNSPMVPLVPMCEQCSFTCSSEGRC